MCSHAHTAYCQGVTARDNIFYHVLKSLCTGKAVPSIGRGPPPENLINFSPNDCAYS